MTSDRIEIMGAGAAADQPGEEVGADEPLPGHPERMSRMTSDRIEILDAGTAADQPGDRISDGDMTGN